MTHREFAASFTVATGHEDPGKAVSSLDWAKLADPARTLVLLMATANLREIARELIAHGLAPTTPVAVVRDGTRPSQRTVLGRLDSIADDVAAAEIGAPAVVIIGGVAALRTQLRWFDAGALFGKRVLITRAGEQSGEFARALLARGAQPLLGPTIAIVPVDDTSAAERAFQDLASYSWLVFTSQNGVDAFFTRLAAGKRDARSIGRAKVAAIGERTAARLRTWGVIADLVPAEFISEEIAREVIARSSAGDRILLYRAQEARDVLPQMLQEAGLTVTIVAAYTTVIPPDADFAQKSLRPTCSRSRVRVRFAASSRCSTIESHLRRQRAANASRASDRSPRAPPRKPD